MKYSPIEPRWTGHLPVSGGHEIYWEESGNPNGLPVIFLHGGPGSGTDPGHRCYFDPKRYRIFLMDQRGCGKSLPFASLEENTTWDLVEDIERLRRSLHVKKWLVFGGSWGSTLGLAYAEKHPGSVSGLILRGIFLGRKKEIDWFYQEGAHRFYAEEWEKYVAPIPLEERSDMIRAYYKRLTSEDPEIRRQAAAAWSQWEGANLRLLFDPALFAQFVEGAHADAIARIECHYFLHRCFFKTDNWLLEQIEPLRKIPGVIIQGRYDLICPFESAYELHRAWPEAEFTVVPNAGHSASEPGIAEALIRATDRFMPSRDFSEKDDLV